MNSLDKFDFTKYMVISLGKFILIYPQIYLNKFEYKLNVGSSFISCTIKDNVLKIYFDIYDTGSYWLLDNFFIKEILT